MGKGNIANPEGLDKVCLDNSSGLGENSCTAIEIEVELESFEEKELVLQFGEEENILSAKDLSYKYSNLLGNVSISIPVI